MSSSTLYYATGRPDALASTNVCKNGTTTDCVIRTLSRRIHAMAYQYKREPLTQEEATRIANACSTPFEKLIVWTLIDTGLRVSELAGLNKDNIDWQTHRITIYGKGGPYGIASKRRIVPMTARVQALLEPYIAVHERFGKGVRMIQRTVIKVSNRASITRKMSPHVLRHTFACTALQKGVSLAALQKILGHDRLETTAIYLNLSPEEALREFREKW